MTNAQSKMMLKEGGDMAPAGQDAPSWPSAAAREAIWGVGTEQVEAVVAGSIPHWLTGTLVYNGGGDYSHMRHMFDGYGFLSRLRVQGGRAWGNQRYVQSKAYKAYTAQGRVVLTEFATPPQGLLGYAQQVLAPFGGLLSRRFPLPPMTDNACVSIHAVGPAAAHSNSNGATWPRSSLSGREGGGMEAADQVQLLAITEDPWGSYMMDPEDLQTLEQVVYPDRVPAIMQSPHPAVLSDGSMVNFSRVFPFGGTHLFRQDRVTLKRQEVAYIPDRHWLTPSWMHDFACTDKYAVLIEQPLYMDFLAMVMGWDNDAVWMRWRPQEGTRLHLVTLDGSKPVKMIHDPIIHSSEKLPVQMAAAVLPCRYVYMANAVRPTNIGNSLAKMDLQTGEVQTWHNPGGVVGEPQFIPKPGCDAEDDGVVLSPCVGADGKAFVLFMDAASWQELARAQVPYSTPYRFHGVWLSGRA